MVLPSITRPRVLCNFAPSLDGKIAPVHKRAPFAMSRHREDGARMRSLRARADAVIIGASNLRADDPDLLPSRIRVVVTRAGAGIDPTAKIFSGGGGGEAIVLHTSQMPATTRDRLRPVATLVELGADDVDVRSMLDWLARERACKEVLCEGGGVLTAAFFAAGAIDELHLTIVPRVLGGAGAPTVVEGAGFAPDQIPDGRVASLERVGDELFVVYAFDWPSRAFWPGD
jgi:5-amino-6-(5-phosphoribosylamino)uracil reductase